MHRLFSLHIRLSHGIGRDSMPLTFLVTLCNLLMLYLYPSAPEFDVSELETLFSATVPKLDSGGKSGGRRQSVGSKTDKVHLVKTSGCVM